MLASLSEKILTCKSSRIFSKNPSSWTSASNVYSQSDSGTPSAPGSLMAAGHKKPAREVCNLRVRVRFDLPECLTTTIQIQSWVMLILHNPGDVKSVNDTLCVCANCFSHRRARPFFNRNFRYVIAKNVTKPRCANGSQCYCDTETIDDKWRAVLIAR